MAQIHICSVCGNSGQWDDNWSWFGSWKELEDGEDIAKFCSTHCADHHKAQQKLAREKLREAKMAAARLGIR